MKRKAVLGFMITLIVVSMLTLAFNIQQVKAGGTIYIRADGSIDPPTPLISTVDNITYTLTGDIASDSDGIVVYRDNIVVDGAGYTVQGTGIWNGITIDWTSNVTIKNVEVTNFDNGIYLTYYSDYNNLSGNIVSNNGIGIYLEGSSYNILSGNTAYSNNGIGIYLDWWKAEDLRSNYNNLTGNTAFSNYGDGIRLRRSYYNNLTGNIVSSNYVIGIRLNASSYNNLTGNIVSNNGIGIALHWDVFVFDEIPYYAYSNYNTLSGNIISSNDGYGIHLDMSDYNNLSGNTVSGNGHFSELWGIELYNSSNNIIFHNNFIDNYMQALNLLSTNVWDDGYPSGGNYWSEYTDFDLYNGPYQNETGSDGIWDHPYVIDGLHNDTYPLIREHPVADANGTYNEVEGVPVTFDGSGSFDPDGAIVSYEWYFGDGNYGTGVSPTHTYAQEGSYDVILIVTDDDGIKDLDYASADISDAEPTADFSGTQTGASVDFTDLSTSYDGITSWEWDFDNDNVVDSTVQNPTHVYSQPGVYTVTLKVYEDDGDNDTETKVDYITISADVAVTDVMLYNPAVCKGYFTPIAVTVENQGPLTETFNVTAYYGDFNIIAEQTINNLPPGNSTTITFAWNTTDVRYGNHTISAVADTIPGETDTADNTYTNGNVLVTFSGDVNGDGIVDIFDLSIVGAQWGQMLIPELVAPIITSSGSFRANITLADVQKLLGYEFTLNYDTSILTAISCGSYPPFNYEILSTIDDPSGYVTLSYITYLGDITGASITDPTPIAWIIFTVDDIGTSVLDLHDSGLMDIFGNPIPHNVDDGFFSNQP